MSSSSSPPASRPSMRGVGWLMSLVHRCAACVCSCGYLCSKFAMAAIGPVLATLATSLILFVVYVYFTHIYPTLTLPTDGGLSLSPLQSYIVTLLGLWLLFVTLFHYAATMFRSPGYPPANTAYSPNLLAMLALDPELHSHSSLPYRYCRRCETIKPMRTHHCAVCNRCVQRMDHRQTSNNKQHSNVHLATAAPSALTRVSVLFLLADCPWVNNCVGHRNYKHFNLFCVYLAILATYFMTVAWQHVTRVMLGRHHDMEMLVACVCSVSACIASLLFVAWNLYLTLTNQTTIEFYSRMLDGPASGRGKGVVGSGNPYNMGWRANFVAVYGPNVWRSLLLPVLSEPPGDGNFFGMNDGRGYPLKELLEGDKV